MAGLGTIINTMAIVFGGICGLLFGKFLKESVQDSLCKACGVSTLLLGISGALEGMLTVEGSNVTGGGTMLVIGCIALGSLIGELLNLEDGMEHFGQWLKIKTGNAKDARFVDAFVTASLTVCIGAMAIVGSIQDGIKGDLFHFGRQSGAGFHHHYRDDLLHGERLHLLRHSCRPAPGEHHGAVGAD